MYCATCGNPDMPGHVCASRRQATATPPGRWLQFCLAVGAGVAALAVLADVDQAALLGSLAVDPAEVSIGHLEASDARTSIVHMLALPVLVVTAVSWLVWFRKLYGGLSRRGASPLRHAKGWALGSWFVPFANLVVPKQMMDDAWRATGSMPAGAPVPTLLAWWWAGFLVSGFVAHFAGEISGSAVTLSELRGATAGLLLSDVLDLFAAVAALVLVGRLSARYQAWSAPAAPALVGAGHRGLVGSSARASG